MNRELTVDWENFAQEKLTHHKLEDIYLSEYLVASAWADVAQRKITKIKIRYAIPFSDFYLLILEINYQSAASEHFLVPLAYVKLAPEKGFIAQCDQGQYLIDAVYEPAFREALFQTVTAQNNITTDSGNLVGSWVSDPAELPENSTVLDLPSSNTLINYSSRYFIKLYRRLYRETNPEAEMLGFLAKSPNVVQLFGQLKWQRSGIPDITLGLMLNWQNHQKDAWSQTGDFLNDFMYAFVDGDFKIKEEAFGSIELMGQRTAELHQNLFGTKLPEEFRAETFDRPYKRHIHRQFETALEQCYEQLQVHYTGLDATSQALAWRFMDSKDIIDEFIDQVLTKSFGSLRLRTHGDLHLGQILATEDGNYVFIDFEGQPNRSIADRKVKHSPLKDVASMVRSFHYAVWAKLFNAGETQTIEAKTLEKATERWYKLVKDTFLDQYFSSFESPHELFRTTNEVNYLLQFHLLEKAIDELMYELSHRPAWAQVPLKGIVEVLAELEKLKN